MSKITESAIADAVVAILSDWPHGEATIAQLIEEIPNRVSLSSDDWEPSPTRPGEPMWHQQVRNITSHKGSRGNAINVGRLVAVPGGLALPRKVA